MGFWKILLALSLFIVFYNYGGYALIVLILNRLRRRRPPLPGTSTPSISFIVAAYNEQDCIRAKIDNSLLQDYPAAQIEYIFITDGSSDQTPDIVREYSAVRLQHRPEREGKSAAINRAVREARHDILIFSDANTLLNPEACRLIANAYHDPRVGGVAGEKKVLPAPGTDQDVGASEGLYWKYESALKKADSEFYSVVGAAGELFSLRKHLFEMLPHNVILDDFVLSLKVAEKGYRVLYEPGAYAMELPSFSLQDEKKRKVRIAAGGFQAIGMLPGLLAFWRNPRLSFLYISHRVLRWTLSPLGMILALIANIILVACHAGTPYTLLLLGQTAFYGTAIATSVFPALNKIKPARLIAYFVFMNFSVVLGFIRFLKGSQSGAWEKARRIQVQ